MKYCSTTFKEIIMDITAIEDNIKELENDATTVDNVKELAFLYIVRDNLKRENLRVGSDEIHDEFEDILPEYRKYVEIKRKYQLGELPEIEVKRSIKRVCKEVYEFIHTLYCCTDMPAERECIDSLLLKLRKL